MTPESPKWNATPEALMIEADVERIGGHHAQAAFIDACASAWKADRIHIEALEKVGRRLLDTLDSCPECNGEPAGKYGHVEGCPLLVLLYPDAAPAKEKSK